MVYRKNFSCRGATMIGLLAPVFWGLTVGVVKIVEETFGIAGGLAITYGVGAAFVACFTGIPRIRDFDRRYLFFGIPLAVIYSLLFTFSLELSSGGAQTLEVGMMNYLWPCLTVLCAVLINGVRAKWYLSLGFVLVLSGIVFVTAGGKGLDPALILGHLSENPLSYALAALGALVWALYSSLTKLWGGGANPTVLIFGVDAAIYSAIAFFGDMAVPEPTLKAFLFCLLTGAIMGAAYAFWVFGIQKGSITVLAIASYFTPVLSCLFGAVLLGAVLTAQFWAGVALVVAGSLVCWKATSEDGN